MTNTNDFHKSPSTKIVDFHDGFPNLPLKVWHLWKNFKVIYPILLTQIVIQK